MHKSLKKILSNAFSKSFNKNYRPISEPSDFNIMTLGCSNAYGAGLKQNEVFDYIIKSALNYRFKFKFFRLLSFLGLPSESLFILFIIACNS